MANEIAITFNDFALSSENNIAVARIEPKDENDIPLTKIPMADFSIAEESKRKAITIDLEGTIIGTDYDSLRSNIDAFKAALQGLHEFTIDDDRYLMAQVRGFSCPFSTLRTIARWSFTLIAHDPFWYSQTLHEDDRTPTSDVGYVINNAGNAPARVKIRVTAPGGGIADACKIENQTNGKSFQYRGTIAAGKILEIDNKVDTDSFEVLNDGVSDFANFEGDFITLDPGNNTIVFTGPAGSQVEIFYRDCWY